MYPGAIVNQANTNLVNNNNNNNSNNLNNNKEKIKTTPDLKKPRDNKPSSSKPKHKKKIVSWKQNTFFLELEFYGCEKYFTWISKQESSQPAESENSQISANQTRRNSNPSLNSSSTLPPVEDLNKTSLGLSREKTSIENKK